MSAPEPTSDADVPAAALNAGNREVAYRVFAAEFDDATLSYSESDEERAPNYVVTPTGARVNRLFLVGVLTEIERVNDEMLRARVVDPTGAFVVYAGQYQPDELAFLERSEPPAFLAVTGKARTFQPEDSERIYTSVRPESISEVDAATRDRWVLGTTERTRDRVAVMAAAARSGLAGEELRAALERAGVSESLAAGVALALDHYGTTGTYLEAVRTAALDAARVVAGERDEVGALSTTPGEGDDATLAALANADLVDALTGVDAGDDPAEATAAGPSTGAESGSGASERGGKASTEEGTPSGPTDTEAPATGDTGPEPARADAGDAATGDAAAADADDGTADTSPASDAEGAGADVEGVDGDDPGEFEPGEFDLDEETRQEVEAEHGLGFETGNEVDDAGEASIESEVERPPAETGAGADTAESTAGDGSEATPASEAVPDDASEAGGPSAAAPGGSEGDAESDTGTGGKPDPEAEAGTGGKPDPEDDADVGSAPEPTEDVDLSEAVVEAMRELDDGDGAAHDEVVSRVVDAHAAAAAEVEDAIQNALMSGRCYEPEDGRLKPI